MDLLFEKRYPHAIEKVWKAITDSDALAQWLMRNDFHPEVGRRCEFRFCAADGEPESVVYVTVEALEPPRFMQWRWRNETESAETTVIFELEPRPDGTLLRLRHRGEAGDDLAERLRRGWPGKLEDLARALD